MAEHLTEQDLARIGAHLVQLAAASRAMGHRSAAATVGDYVLTPDNAPWTEQFVADMFLLCRIGTDGRRERADERVADVIDRFGLLDVIAESVTR
jgi:hypothetical protein